MQPKKSRVIEKAIELLAQEKDGIRYANLLRKLQPQLPDLKPAVIQAAVLSLPAERPLDVIKPEKGLFLHTKFQGQKTIHTVIAPSPAIAAPIAPKEHAFYESVARFFEEEEDCSKACPVGGSKFGVKWGTPDVIGVQKARESDVVKFPTVILSAEVKVDGGALVTAFGQACAYTLFSHKSYIVVPANSQKDDLDRLESLCVTMGLGLVVFDHMNSDNPNFTFRARSRQFNPHPFYVNINMKQLEKELFH